MMSDENLGKNKIFYFYFFTFKSSMFLSQRFYIWFSESFLKFGDNSAQHSCVTMDTSRVTVKGIINLFLK